ncbi:relaxase/mobilization nuclease RlxS [Novosphingobium sp. RL4]|uniref:relaxase/mobilization nuclease RlxS n=1 Tax=Novosphingobium sp. RL4 TaxID=3109595 RepID=UPI002D766B99|nr:relaxase/mobilization nuclease RlxS [Novosphingobium sp. RL4]WRT94487.1 relaxase/mobilization nuclease RlxS [Novosphingobium sp. RL4]
MPDDEDFEPRLGRQGRAGRNRPQRYAARIAVAAGLNAKRSLGRPGRFDGSRIGRGAAVGRLLSTRKDISGLRSRRVVVKTRLAKLGGKGFAAARAHLHYIQRDGVTREGKPGVLYGPAEDRVSGGDFLEGSKDDRHQFRFIVSAEDGDRYGDLKPYVRGLMKQVEQDLGTKLDWVAVDHFNTGHPHSHIVLRGIDEQGKDLVIAREYISHGLRERAAEIMTRDLGPRTDLEIEERLRHDVTQERLTVIDRRLLARIGPDRIVAPQREDGFFQSLETGRLSVLGKMGLAEEVGEGSWRLAEGMEDSLRGLGERGDIIRLMQRELTRARIDRRDHQIHTPASGPLIGQVVQRGLSDEHRDRHYLLVDGTDGRSHYVEIGNATSVEPFPAGATVRVTARPARVREMDRTIFAVAQANAGRYSSAIHRAQDPSVSAEYADGHLRRLEAMRRSGIELTREVDGTWSIGPDHLALVEQYEARRHRARPVDVEVLASGGPEHLASVEGASWLDRELAGPAGRDMRDSGFGREVREALNARRQWLIEQGFVEERVVQGGRGRIDRGVLAVLQRRELLLISEGLADELGKTFAEAKTGQRIEGKLTRRIDAVSGRFALLEKSREFTLVPWRPVMEKQVGKQAGGIMRESGINWEFGRGRSGPGIS